jgi:hypothetical protein
MAGRAKSLDDLVSSDFRLIKTPVPAYAGMMEVEVLRWKTNLGVCRPAPI